ncbi:hypothetical protein AaE_015359 [Aphanomyces astaci]|uniref:Tc1-like transposase DDE domain-containing protein n=1 Tax=Aphanomyces astaci TaxID=112090 RepID=A0A6A4YXM4_APHAT|nr:hypothetical protein AaE_015359 [Aphanomyces astaci]
MLKRVSSSLRPLLTDANKDERVAFARSFMTNDPDGSMSFVDMYDYIHVVEKWLYLRRTNTRFYVWHNEEPPHQTTKSKRFITKVMFFVAVARPRWDDERGEMFDGKLGCWPFVAQEPAIRSSRNRVRGTLETRPIAVNAAVYQRFLSDRVLPAIFAKFPRQGAARPLFIQHDNAGPHQGIDHGLLTDLAREYRWDVRIRSQPPNSPDFNVLDLGFFNSIQSLQYQSVPKNIDELVDAVENAFVALTLDTLARTFVTLQKVLDLSFVLQGGNNYKLLHLKKASLALDCTSYNVKCSADSVEMSLLSLNCRLEEEARLDELFAELTL